MIKNSTELITACKEALEKMLSRCLEKGVQPSYYEMYQRGYACGYTDARDMQPEDLRELDQWHWVETEGVPPTDDKCWCLVAQPDDIGREGCRSGLRLQVWTKVAGLD